MSKLASTRTTAIVESDGQDEIDDALVVEPACAMRRKSYPRRRGPGSSRVPPPARPWPGAPARWAALGLVHQGADVRVGHAEFLADLDVVRPLVGCAREIADHQDRQFAQPRIELALEADEAAERAERAQAVGAVAPARDRCWRGAPAGPGARAGGPRDRDRARGPSAALLGFSVPGCRAPAPAASRRHRRPGSGR